VWQVTDFNLDLNFVLVKIRNGEVILYHLWVLSIVGSLLEVPTRGGCAGPSPLLFNDCFQFSLCIAETEIIVAVLVMGCS
jgi:hypothetical protein